MAWYWYIFWIAFILIVLMGVIGQNQIDKKEKELKDAELNFYKRNS